MADNHTIGVAKKILDDLGNASLFADPKLLGRQLIQPSSAQLGGISLTEQLGYDVAVGALGVLFRRYARSYSPDDVTALADYLQGKIS